MAALTRGVTPRSLALLFLAPFAFGILQQVLKKSHRFLDFEALFCGGLAYNAGQDLYVWSFACPNAQPTSFVYTPVVAIVFGYVQELFGTTVIIAVFGGFYFYIVLKIFGLLLADDGRLRDRVPFLAGLSASALFSGNISIVFHGMIYLLGRKFTRWPVLMLPPLIIAAVAKPTFAVYFAVFLFAKCAIWQRILMSSVGVMATGLYFGFFYLHDATAFEQWQKLANYYGMVANRGHGFMGLPFINAMEGAAGIFLLYLAFAAVILCAGLAIAELCLDSEGDRITLGIAVCILLYPRLMAYDFYTIPFGLAVAVQSFTRWRGLLSWIVPALCMAFALVGGQMGGRLLFGTYCVLLMFLAVAALTARGVVRRSEISHRDF